MRQLTRRCSASRRPRCTRSSPGSGRILRRYRLPLNLSWVKPLSTRRPEFVPLFTVLNAEAVARWGAKAVADGRQWSLPLADQVLLIAVYYQTNLTMRQLAPLFGITQAAVHWVITGSVSTWPWPWLLRGSAPARMRC